MIKTSDSGGSDKLPAMEGLRWLATISVLFWHYQHFAFVGASPAGLVRNELPYAGLLFPFYEAGEYAVWIFWGISGFIFFWKYGDAVAERSLSGWTFFVFRLSRLYPLHFMTLLLVALLQPIYFARNGSFFVYQYNDIQHFIPQLVMASNWLPTQGESFNGPIWSVSVEVLVYAFFFLTLRHAKKSPLFNLAVIAVCLNVPLQACTCLALFYAGGLAAMGRQTMQHSQRRFAVELLAWCAAIALPIAVFSVCPVAVFGMRFSPAVLLFLVGYTPILLFCLSARMGLPRPIESLLTAAGNMTYSAYLLHFPIQLATALAYSIARRPIPYHDDWFCAAFVIVTLLAAHLTYRHFEAPAQAFIRSRLLRRPEAELSRSVRPSFDLPRLPGM
ncbi:MAG TPA: acyltransferase [Bradyrhizobium sp.]|nr:acyltransferase [Bradyrhizobium sp.]